MIDTKIGVPTLLFVSFRQIDDPIEKRRFKVNFKITEKTHLRHFKIKYTNKRKSSNKRFFSMHSKPIFLERKQEAGLLRCISLAFDNSKSRLKKRCFEINFSKKQTT